MPELDSPIYEFLKKDLADRYKTMAAETLHLWTNPDYSESVIFHGLDAISFRDTKRRKKYSNVVKETLSKIYCENWPYNRSMMIAIKPISGPASKYGRRDLDNMAKVILDAGNKIIYNDDHLVEILLVQKQLLSIVQHGFIVATRPLSPGWNDKYSPRIIDVSDVPGKAPVNAIQPVIFTTDFIEGQLMMRHVLSAAEL